MVVTLGTVKAFEAVNADFLARAIDLSMMEVEMLAMNRRNVRVAAEVAA